MCANGQCVTPACSADIEGVRGMKSHNDFAGLLRSNECRLEALHNAGLEVAADGRAILEFFFDLVQTTNDHSEFVRNWARNVAGLLSWLEVGATAS